jgi:hypothetical protein
VIAQRFADVARYDVRRSDAPDDRDCSGPPVSSEVTLSDYRFGSILWEHASVLLLACSMLVLGASLVAVRPRSGAPQAPLAAGYLYLFGLTVWPFCVQVIDLVSGPRLWPFVIGDTANALFWGALLLMAASLPREGLPPLGVVIVCFLLPLVLHLVDVGVAMREPSELGKLARLITVSSAGSRVRRLRAASKPGLSLLSVTSDLKLSSSYRNSMVKHEPELHTCVASVSSSTTRLTN